MGTNFIWVIAGSLSKKKQHFWLTVQGLGTIMYESTLNFFIRIVFIGDDYKKIQIGSVAVVDNFCSCGWLIYHWFVVWEDRLEIHVAWTSGKIFILFTRVSMSSTILSTAKSSHQSHDKYSDISRGRKYTFNYWICAQSCPLRYCWPYS